MVATPDANPDVRRALPSVDAVLRDPALASLLAEHPRGIVADAVRDELADRRLRHVSADGIADATARRLAPTLRRVINATGVVLHTNLGRAPLADAAIAAAVGAAGYCSLEWDPETGRRGSRHEHAARHVRALTGAEAACVANTCAGAVLVALVALAAGREVIVSRGQLVEIGGGFRVPEVLAASGCRLVEVGTTNRTRIEDYATAIGPQTGAILRVYPSNFRVVGFTEDVALDGLAALAHEHGLPLIDDLGSGALTGDVTIADEPTVGGSIAAGADVVCFSTDKLLGGPQGGVLAGRAEAIDRIVAHPLMRALRPDKLTLAALTATLRLHRDSETALSAIPTLAAFTRAPDELRARAARVAAQTGGDVVATIGRVGGGALPLAEIPSYAVALLEGGPIARALRSGDPAVVVRVAEGRMLLDVLACSDSDLAELPHCLARARGL